MGKGRVWNLPFFLPTKKMHFYLDLSEYYTEGSWGERGLRLIWSIIKQLLNTEVSKQCFENLKFWNHTTVPPGCPEHCEQSWGSSTPLGFMRTLCLICTLCTLHTLYRALCAHFQIFTLPSKLCLAAVCALGALRSAVSENHCVFCNLSFATSTNLQCPDFSMKSSTTMVFIILLIFTVQCDMVATIRMQIFVKREPLLSTH